MMNQKVALITGGSRGLGKSAAMHLAQSKVGVVITYHRKQEEAQTLVNHIQKEGGRAVALQLDVTETARFYDFVDELKTALKNTFGSAQIDYLVNNAGYGLYKSFEGTTGADLDAMFAVHFKGPFLLTQSLAGLMKDGGRILNVSSGLTRFTLPGYDGYAAMKGAIEVATRYQAAALASRGITVNTLAPGAIETDFGGGVVRDNPELNQRIASITAMGRVGLPDDIGSAIAGALTAGSGWMTGQRIEVSGGQAL